VVSADDVTALTVMFGLDCCFVVRGESPGYRLISTASMLEWLINSPPPLTGEQYGKMEPKYPEGGHCQRVY